jgi:DNA-binding transcriptional ArsR family regulator
MTVGADPNFALVARLIGERTRAAFLDALMDTPPRSLSELARGAAVTPATASVHLSKLADAGLVRATTRGRRRYFELGGPSVAEALETLSLLAPPRPVRSLRDASLREALAAARTCYDHLAGRLGVRLADALVADGLLGHDGQAFELTATGRRRFGAFGIDVGELERGSRPLTRACLDWTERRHHLAGALGAALAAELLGRGWLVRSGGGRAVRLTPAGRTALADEFGLAA